MVTDNPKSTEANENRSPVELIKEASQFLRGTILEGLDDTTTGAISKDDTQLIKFHGSYQQDDRDLRKERRKANQEPAYSFMIRIKAPGGVCTSQQWLDVDRMASDFANETIKITNRQAFQLHGVIKSNLKQTIREINETALTTIAACGDVNRNVMLNPNPEQSKAHAQAIKMACAISDHLSPRTTAYHEIWLTDENGDKFKVTEDPDEIEPIYGRQYLPRKFKTVIAVPPSNDVDIFAQDLGFIAILEGEDVVGYNITVGGGMGMDHNKVATYPRLAQILGYVPTEKVVDVAEKIVTVQRDYGDRANRKHARLKYTIDDRGLAWFRKEVESRLGYKLEAPKPFHFEDNGDRFGWTETTHGDYNLTLFIENGRVRDSEGAPTRTGLRELAKAHSGEFRLTANQNLVIANISKENRPRIEAILSQYGLDSKANTSGMRLGSMACVALPTCGLALAESERQLPSTIDEIEGILEEYGLSKDSFTIRMTGCPNGCGRPYIAEIGFVGKAPNKYNVYLGGGYSGDRLNKLYRTSVKTEEITDLLRPLIERYAKERNPNERFGDFVVRVGIVAQTIEGKAFHDDVDNPKPGIPYSAQTLPKANSAERKTFDDNFRREAVAKARESSQPLAHIARDLEVAPSTLRGWMKRF